MEQNQKDLITILTIGGIVLTTVIIILAITMCSGSTQHENLASPRKEFAEYSTELVQRAERGDAQAQYSLGNCYFYGFGVTKDQHEAVKWLRRAAEQGHTAAQNDLGHCYYSGAGVERNEEEAERWWKKAAEIKK